MTANRSNAGRLCWWMVGLCAAGSACSGQIGPAPTAVDTTGSVDGPAGMMARPGRGAAMNGAATPGSADPAKAPGETGSPGQPAPLASGAGPMTLQRLSREEYANTVRDLLRDKAGTTSSVIDDFQPEPRGESGFATPPDVGAAEVDRFRSAAERLGTDAAKRLDEIATPCDTAAKGESECAKSFVQEFGRRAFRRPLDDLEVTPLLDLYQAVRAAPLKETHQGAMGTVIKAILQSPRFLYHWEGGGLGAQKEGTLVKLAPYEVASRMSYLLWRSMPDDALLAEAEGKRLATPALVEAQARRLMQDPRAGLDTTTKDTSVYPDWNAALAKAMGDEARAFIKAAALDDGHLATLLLSSESFANEALAKLYGAAAVKGTALTKVKLPTEQRFGLLTLGAFLAVQGNPYASHPVKRGHFIRERLMCQFVAPPPGDLNVQPVKDDPARQTRELYQQHSQDPVCAGCHARMDPLGFALENYDGIGKWRDSEKGRAVDATGTVTGIDNADTKFSGPRAFMQTLAQSGDVRHCLAGHFMRLGLDREIEPSEEASFAEAYSAFQTSGFDLRELLVAIVKTKSFLYRTPTTEELTP